MSMRINGLASGMDIDSIVQQLMQAERIPLDKLTQQKIWTEWQHEAYREINLSLYELQRTAGNLRFQSAFNVYSAISSNEDIFTVTATEKALPGTYKIKVDSIASGAKMHSSSPIMNENNERAQSTDRIGVSGEINIKQGNEIIATLKVESDWTFNKLASEIQKETAKKPIELRANFDDATSRFFISTKGMGVNQNFTLDFGDNIELANKVINNNTTSYTTDNAKDGKIFFDGIEIDGLTKNQVNINGLTVNLIQENTEEQTLTVQSDTTKVVESIKSFVEQYNKIIEKIETKLNEKRYRDFPPLLDEQKEAMEEKQIELWEEKAKSGLLRNDSLLSNAVINLRRAWMDPVEGIASGQINLLSQIGISTSNYREGSKLKIDEEKLTEALTERPDEVIQLFTKKSDGLGIADRIYNELDNIFKRLSDRAGNPNNSVDTNSTLAKQIRQMDEQINRWQDRLIRIENRYFDQFTLMEKAINQMNQQSLWMQQNLFGGM